MLSNPCRRTGTPAAVIEWGTTPGQRVVEGTARTIPQVAIDADIQPPALTVIGEVVRLREQGVRWFDLETQVAIEEAYAAF